jgi:hypothetical protein
MPDPASNIGRSEFNLIFIDKAQEEIFHVQKTVTAVYQNPNKIIDSSSISA